MLLIAFSGMLIGAALGLELAVVALLPIMLSAIIAAAVALTISDASIITVTCWLTLFLVVLQIGYLGAAALRLSQRRVKQTAQTAGSEIRV